MPGNGRGNGTPYQTQEQLNQQAEAQAEAQSAGDGGFFDFAGDIVARMKASIAAGQRWSAEEQRLSQGAQYRQAPNLGLGKDYMGHDHSELKQWTDAANPGSVGDSAAAWTSLANTMATLSRDLDAAGKTEGGNWSGKAAEKAAAFNAGTSAWADSTGQYAQLASHRMSAQSEAAESAKNSMPEPIPFSWEEEFAKWESAGPFELNEAVESSIQRHEESQAAHRQGAQVLSARDQTLLQAAGQQPAFAPPPTFASAGGGGDDPGGGGPIGGTKNPPQFPGGGGTTPSRGGGTTPSGGGGTTPSGSDGNGGLPPGAVRLPDGSIRYPDGTIVKPDGTRILPDGTKILPDGTRILPNGKVIPPGNTSSSGLNSGSGSDAPSSFGPGGGSGAGAGAAGGGAAGFGPLGAGAGAGAAAGAGGLGAGKGGSAGGFGPGAGGAKGAMGGRGMGGMMGGAGAGGGRGQGDDDKEHKDQYYLKQEMDPGLQVEYDEYGEKLVDETTGQIVVPPVIGE